MKDTQNYEEKYIAFVDILGFKKNVIASSSETEVFNKIVTAFGDAARIENLLNAKLSEWKNSDNWLLQSAYELIKDTKLRIFSDTFFISAEATRFGLASLEAYCCLIYITLFSNGFFCRGAITKGKLYEKDNIIFGEGLINAYELESQASIFPRIIISETILPEWPNDYCYKKRATDGLYFIDVFGPDLKKIIDGWKDEHDFQISIAAGRKHLEDQYSNATEASVKAKLYWLIDYFNSSQINHSLSKIDV